MKTTTLLVLAAAVVSLAAGARGRSLQEPAEVDVEVAGQSRDQLNASRYHHVPAAREQQSAAASVDDVEAPEVMLPGLGSLKGTVSATEQGKRPIFQYLGIPFAEAPVGERRFVAPVPKAPWSGTLDATKPGKMCIQTDQSVLLSDRKRRHLVGASAADQSEDCLVLNVHTPKVDPDAKLPVLVFVHGGAFLTGYAGQKTPEGLLDDDVILVSPQYRLGPLGFLNLQTDGVPGNAGLLDIVEALRWVNKNIQYFGGDPTRVTLGGHSAGAASASLLYLSPLTKGLIQGVMPMSGSALAFWAWDRSPEQANTLITAAAGCGNPLTKPLEERVSCLQNAPAKGLVIAYGLVALMSLKQGSLGMSGIIPSVQKAGVKVLPDLPENIIGSKDFSPLPYMTGVTKHEGSYPLQIAESGYLSPNHLQENSSFVRNDLIHVLLKVIGDDDPSSFVADSVLQAYIDPLTLGDYNAMRDGLIDLSGAFGFKSPARRIVERNADLGVASYLYAFNHNGIVSKNSAEGIFHGADQPYIFPDGSFQFEGDDLKIALTLRKLITNFVIYQNPTPSQSPVTVAGSTATWPQFARDSEHYLEVVWPPAERQWFTTQLTVARAEASGGGGATTRAGGDTTDSTGAAAPSAPLPMAALLVAVAVALLYK